MARGLLPNKAKTDEHGTPRYIFDPLNAVHKFTLDAAANEFNAKCKNYFTKEDDGTKQPWKGHSVFFNPPYDVDSLTAFILKAITECLYDNVPSVGLLPVKADQAWYHLLQESIRSQLGVCDEVIISRRHPKVLDLIRSAKICDDWWNYVTVKVEWILGRVKYEGNKDSAGFPSFIVKISSL